MRRYLTTILLLMAMLAVGGWAVVTFLGGGPTLERGAYVPQLSSDPQVASQQAIMLVGGLGLLLLLTVGLGIFLAITFSRITRLMRSLPTSGSEPVRAGAPRPAGRGEAPSIPLSNDRSVAIFWVVVVVLVVGFQALRYIGTHSVHPFGYVPGLTEQLSLPGGLTIPAALIVLGVLGATVVGVAVVGFALARGLATLDNTVRTADALPRTLPDRLIPAVEQRVAALLQPRARRAPAPAGLDGLFTAVNVLLFLVIAAIVVFYVIPSYSYVARVDASVKATQVAASIKATPQEGGPASGGGQSQTETLQKDLDALPAGNASGGEQVYNTYGCSACHTLDGSPGVAPSFQGVGQRAATRKPDYSAPLYLYESITNPNAFVVQGFPGGVMPQDFKQRMQPQELADVIAWLESK